MSRFVANCFRLFWITQSIPIFSYVRNKIEILFQIAHCVLIYFHWSHARITVVVKFIAQFSWFPVSQFFEIINECAACLRGSLFFSFLLLVHAHSIFSCDFALVVTHFRCNDKKMKRHVDFAFFEIVLPRDSYHRPGNSLSFLWAHPPSEDLLSRLVSSFLLFCRTAPWHPSSGIGSFILYLYRWVWLYFLFFFFLFCYVITSLLLFFGWIFKPTFGYTYHIGFSHQTGPETLDLFVFYPLLLSYELESFCFLRKIKRHSIINVINISFSVTFFISLPSEGFSSSMHASACCFRALANGHSSSPSA